MDPNYAALSASDGAGEPVRATVQSPGRSIGSTTIPVQATTNWPTGTFIATTGTLLSSGKLDPTTVQVFYGTASGTDITITAFAAGYSDVGNAAGDVVVIKPTTEWANIVSEGILGTTQFPANFANFVEASGGAWSAGAGLVGSGTAGFVWYNGARSAMAAVTNHTFAASKDTYIDYNPTAATLTYLPETNGAIEPAVSTGSVRIAKVVTGASAISSISQIEYSNPVVGAPVYNPYKFSVYLKASSQTVTSNTASIVIPDTARYDTSSNFDLTTGLFTAPVAGFYHFNGTVLFTSTLSGHLGGAILAVNGSALVYGNSNSGNTTQTAFSVERTLKLSSGDTVALWQTNTSGAAVTVAGGSSDYTFFEGELKSAT
jgi:hypothetical protein